MYVSRLRLENIRSFGVPSDIRIPAKPGWYVFAGRNGSGKTTLLRAIGLAIAGPNFAPRLMPSFSRWVRQSSDRASLKVNLVPHKVDRLEGGGVRPKELTGTLEWSTPGWVDEPELSSVPARAKATGGIWRGPWSNNPRGWLVAGYGPLRRISGHGSGGQREMDGPTHVRRMATLFSEEASLAETVEWLKTVNHKALEKDKAAKTLQDRIVELLNSGLLPERVRVESINSRGLTVKRGTTLIDLVDLSDGYRVALGLVLDIVRHMSEAHGELIEEYLGDFSIGFANAGVVLIDEADAHLHVEWQRRIGSWLTERFPAVQFIVTTHSPFICQSASLDGLFRLPDDPASMPIAPVDPDTYFSIVNGTADDAVVSSLFGLDRSESDRANKLRQEWSTLEARRLRKGLSAEEAKRHTSLRKQLPLPIDPAAE